MTAMLADTPPVSPAPAVTTVALQPWDRLFMSILGRINTGSARVTLADGRMVLVQGSLPGPEVHIRLVSPLVGKAVALRGALGFAESYMDGGWHTPDLPKLLYFFLLNMEALQQSLQGKPWARLLQRLLYWTQRNTRTGSRRNIAAHYDLGNDFYRAWLDDSMSYSAGIFPSTVTTLEESQGHKYQRILDELPPLTDRQHILEIGCGWGGFLEHAAPRCKARLSGITISEAQHTFAVQRLAALHPRVQVRLEDYRDHDGRYDHIVSIEMLEAVGEQYWPVYFRRLKEMLKPGGKVVIQSIVIDERYYEQYARSVDFIRAHVFPGGMLPSLEKISQHAARSYLRVDKTFRFGHDYARTLQEWRTRFEKAWPSLQQLPSARQPFDDRFKRLWDYYLAYCEAGFLCGRIDICQVTLVHDGGEV